MQAVLSVTFLQFLFTVQVKGLLVPFVGHIVQVNLGQDRAVGVFLRFGVVIFFFNKPLLVSVSEVE